MTDHVLRKVSYKMPFMSMERSIPVKQILFYFLVLLFLLLDGGLACKQQKKGQQEERSQALLSIWAHAGQERERKILQAQIARFNQQSETVNVQLTFIPERDYNAQVQAAAIAGDLPDILEFDGPYLYNYIWQGHLVPLEKLLPQSLIEDILPSIIDQGTHGGHLYSIGVFDSGLGLFGRKNLLENVGARIPRSFSEAWSVDEFEKILSELAQKDPDGAVLDIKLNYGGEWLTYGFSPILQSAGADLIDRRHYPKSSGVLNGPKAVEAMNHLQQWFKKGYVDQNIDDAAFATGRVAFSWVGHWEYDRYAAVHDNNLLLLPLPDFGKGSKTGQGSWNWGITGNCSSPEKAVEFITFLMRTDEILAMSDANGAVPGTKSAVEQSFLYSDEGPLHLFAEQLLGGASVTRPKTPAYPVITNEFQKAFRQIRNNGDVQEALNKAAFRIDQDIRDNNGYPFTVDR